MKTPFVILFLFCVTLFEIISAPYPDVEGWKKSPIRVFNTENLWDHINGAAGSYHAYAFVKLEVFDYMLTDDKYITVEVYHHATPENAFGIYSSERPEESNFLNIGSEGYYEENFLNFLKGSSYIKMRGSGELISKNILIEIAKALNDSLPGNESLPTALKKLPTRGKIKHSSMYVNQNFLGYPSLYDAYIADYMMDDKEFRFFVFDRKTENEIDEFLTPFLTNRSNMNALPIHEIVEINDPYNGTIFFLKKGNYVLGSVDLTDKDIFKKVILSEK
jgi:hypothetical protein